MMVFDIGDDRRFNCPESAEDVTIFQYITFLNEVAPSEPKELSEGQQLNVRINQLMDDLAPWIEKAGGKRDDITASEAVAILQTYMNRSEVPKKATFVVPPLLAELREAEGKQSAIINRMGVLWYAKNMLPYMSRVVEHFTGLPYEEMMAKGGAGISRHHLEYLYRKILKAATPEFKGEYKRSFLFNGEVYELPQKHMSNSTLIEFAEAAQFQENAERLNQGKVEALLDVVSVILRKSGEMYSDEVYERNREEFKQLPLSVVMDCAFFLMKQSNIYALNLATYTTAAEVKASQRPRKLDTMKTTAGTLLSSAWRKAAFLTGRTLRR
jgi:hypothetical protein